MWRFIFRFSPHDWEPAQPMPGSVITLGRKGCNGNITITVQRAAKNKAESLEEQTKGVEKQLSSTVPNFKKESTTDTVVSALPGKCILYSGSADNTLIKFKQLFFTNKDLLYFFCVADAESTFEQTIRDSHPVIDSFVVK